MATVPLPDTPCLRVRVTWNTGTIGEGGTRFYLSYSGSAPSGANCTTIAADIAAPWSTYLGAMYPNTISLNEVDVIDIATELGASGQWVGTAVGTRSGNALPFQVATNVEYGIAERYRGGKPRGFFPAGVSGDLVNEAHWDGDYIDAMNAAVGNFYSHVAAISVGSVGTLKHVNLSYYHGYTNVEVPDTRAYAKPTYRATALHFDITGYSTKAVLGSQRRRRTSTTP